MHRMISVVLVLVVVTLGLILLPAWAQDDGRATHGETSPEPRSEGHRIYIEHCASCHGSDLRGGNATSMVDGVWQYGGREWDMIRNTMFGISAAGMPAFEEALSSNEIREVIRFIRDEGQRLEVRRPVLPEMLQTREYGVATEVWIDEGQLESPWALTFIDADTALITEKQGTLRLVENGVVHPDPIADTPEVLVLGQGGLMEVEVDPNYADAGNGWIYLGYTHAAPAAAPDRGDRNQPGMTRIVRGRIVDHAWVDEELVFEADASMYRTAGVHFGTRIVFDDQGHLYFPIGDRGAGEHAQDLSRPNGKIHRVNRDGTIPADNPFVDTPGALSSVWSYGHRNPQGLAVHPQTGRIWETEHGPMGGDEMNVIDPKLNYGWPEITYGINYNGTIITDETRREGMQQPVHYWVPSIAVCGIAFCDGDEFPRWQNDLFVGGLSHEILQRFVLDGDRVIHRENILQGAGRVRDVACGPDGSMYVILNAPDRIVRLTQGNAVRRQ